MERQHIIFVAAAAGGFAVLIALAYFNPFQPSEAGENGNSSDVIKARRGEQVFVRYSSNVVKLIQDLPSRNALELEVSSELQVNNLAGLRGELRYTDMEITYVQGGVIESIDDNDFKTIEYRFLPDAGNKTKYLYDNVDYIVTQQDSQVIVSVMPLSSAKVGEQYTVKLALHTGGVIGYAIDDKIIEIVG